jgi:hypothetical protein
MGLVADKIPSTIGARMLMGACAPTGTGQRGPIAVSFA